jgi:tryptophanyl-tRNA synthetase
MRVLSGMQPSGEAHLGNYLGSIKPNVDLLGAEENIYIIVDLHALTTIGDPEALRRYRLNLVKDLLACGFQASKAILFFQSAVPEHTELLWILSCVTPVGLLERAVAYKEKVEQGLEATAGLFLYPVLQAADILLYDADVVPVGKDQKQHLEIARDIAQKFNRYYGKGVLVVPEAKILEEVAVVPGTDGRKMSKSYGNTIPLFSEDSMIEQAIMGIVTDSRTVEEPKDPESCLVFQLHALLLDDAGKRELAQRYRAGGLGYSEAKRMFLQRFQEVFGPMRRRRAAITDEEAQAVVTEGSKRARTMARRTLERVWKAVGIG